MQIKAFWQIYISKPAAVENQKSYLQTVKKIDKLTMRDTSHTWNTQHFWYFDERIQGCYPLHEHPGQYPEVLQDFRSCAARTNPTYSSPVPLTSPSTEA